MERGCDHAIGNGIDRLMDRYVHTYICTWIDA